MSVVVMIYSKYSPSCDKLLQLINPVLDFRKICIDNNNVRQLVLTDPKNYNIRQVPCILVFYSNGVMNKYEGEEAFRWAHDTIEKMTHLSTPRAPLPPQPSLLSQPVYDKPIPVEHIKPDNQPLDTKEEPSTNHRRLLDSAPLSIQPIQKKEENHEDHQIRGIKNDKQENLLSLAQQMQKQREQEEEVRNPNAIHKIN